MKVREIKIVNDKGERSITEFKYITMEKRERLRIELLSFGIDIIENGKAILMIDGEAMNVEVKESRTIIVKNRTAVTKTVMFAE